jgi:putative phosphoribosyl transferase
MRAAVPFDTRHDAGAQLANALAPYRDQNPVIVALPRGGVPVGFEIARHLHGTLDLLLVRKIGAPMQPELALGALVDGDPPLAVWNDEIVAELDPGQAYLDAEQRRQAEEIARRRALYRGNAPPVPLADRTVIVVDDGVATGSTMKVALKALRAQHVAQLVVAVPVAPRDIWLSIAQQADDAACLAFPEHFGAVGFYYRDFAQLDDSEVIELLITARRQSS